MGGYVSGGTEMMFDKGQLCQANSYLNNLGENCY